MISTTRRARRAHAPKFLNKRCNTRGPNRCCWIRPLLVKWGRRWRGLSGQRRRWRGLVDEFRRERDIGRRNGQRNGYRTKQRARSWNRRRFYRRRWWRSLGGSGIQVGGGSGGAEVARRRARLRIKRARKCTRTRTLWRQQALAAHASLHHARSRLNRQLFKPRPEAAHRRRRRGLDVGTLGTRHRAVERSE